MTTIIDGQPYSLGARGKRMLVMLARHADKYEKLSIGRVVFDIANGRLVLRIEHSADMVREDG